MQQSLTNIVFDDRLSSGQWDDDTTYALVLHMMNTLQRYPLPSSFHEDLPQPVLVRIKLDRVGVQRVDLHGSLERGDEEPALHSPKGRSAPGPANLRLSIALTIGPFVHLINSINVLADQVVETSTTADADLRRRDEAQSAWFARYRACRDQDGTRDEDGVKQVPGDLAVRSEVLDCSDCTLVVSVKVVDENAHGGHDVRFFLRAFPLLQFGLIRLKLREECDQHLRTQLHIN